MIVRCRTVSALQVILLQRLRGKSAVQTTCAWRRSVPEGLLSLSPHCDVAWAEVGDYDDQLFPSAACGAGEPAAPVVTECRTDIMVANSSKGRWMGASVPTPVPSSAPPGPGLPEWNVVASCCWWWREM